LQSTHEATILPYNSTDIGLLFAQNTHETGSFFGSGQTVHVMLCLRGYFHYLKAMSLTLSDVKHIADLAQLEVSDSQAAKTLSQLNGIFALVNQMSTIDTSGIEPLSHPIAALMPDLSLRLREDLVTEPDRRDAYQQPAPATQDGLYLVPKVIE
jgi:aspartyl-tRNA(Asn)/glutamyl-tRNA(Gln) amidotransferase subunit C